MYLIVVAVLSLALAFSGPLYRWLEAPAHVLTFMAAVTVFPALVAAIGTRLGLRRLDDNAADPGDAQDLLGNFSLATNAALALGHGALLVATSWLTICQSLPRIGDWPLLPTLIAVTPFLIAIFLVWLAGYPADRALRQIAFEVHMFRGRPARPSWPLFSYLAYNFRHQVLFVLLPLLILVAARDVIRQFDPQIAAFTRNRYAPDLLLGTCAALMAVIAPAILRRVWSTQPLPEGPLRDRLLLLCKRLRMRCREILVWRSGGRVVNAAVMGVVPPLRYVLLTDALLEQMDDTRIEAVFGHEAGHVKRHHILYFLLFAFVTGCLVTVLTVRDPHLKFGAIAGGLLLLKWGVLFGWISRNFERQADAFGVHTLALAGTPCQRPCALHSHEIACPTASFRAKHALCATAAEIFSDTLNQVAVLNGIVPEARSWRHSSISSRSRFVQKLAADPRAAFRFERRLVLIKLAIFTAAVGSGLWAAFEIELWKLFGLLGG